jgi:flavin-dependent dehydrogenase
MDVLLVDRQGFGTDTLSTHALMRGGVMQLSRWGLLGPLLQRGTPLVTTTSFHYGTRELRIPLRTSEDVPGLIAPRRTVLDRVLVEAASAAGANVRHHVVAKDLLRRRDGRVSGVLLRDAGGDEHVIGAGLVVGADGIGSSVARLAGAAVKRRGQASASTIYAYLPSPGEPAYHWYYRMAEGGQGPLAAGAIPTNDGQTCVFVSQPTSDFDATSRFDVRGAYLAILKSIGAGLGARAAEDSALTLSVFRGRPGLLRAAAGRGWLLVGDAGFFRDPLTAHGITDALRDAQGAASAILGGLAADFRRYEAERNEIAMRLLESTEKIVAFDWDYTCLESLHKELNATMKDEVAMLSARGYAAGRPAEPTHMVLVSPPST